MFDAKGMLDALIRGGAEPPRQRGGLGGVGDLLRQLQLGKQRRDTPPAAAPAGEPERESAGPPGGGIEDMLRKALAPQGGSWQDALGRLGKEGGRLGDILGQVLGHAASGVREGAARINAATGASRYAREATTQITGSSPEDVVAQMKKLVADNPATTSAAVAGLSAVILGTGAGRSLAGTAVKLGSLALVGGLAYKALQNYQQGRPVLSGARPQAEALFAAPNGSGFEASAVTHESATLLIRAMIAAAAADGRIDEKERQTIRAGLRQAGLESDAQQFLTRELDNPATPDELANAVSSPTEAMQVYTAARIAVDPDIGQEHEFLLALAARLGIDEQLAAQIDAAARGAGA